jgi:hypothetical protein
MPERRPRPELAETIVQLLRKSGMRVVPPTGWEAYDALVLASAFVRAQLITSAHPQGWLQLRMRRSLRWKPLLLAASAIALVAAADPRLAMALAVGCALNVALGLWRTGIGLHRILTRRAAP